MATDGLAAKLVRNIHDLPLERSERAPLYDSSGSRLAPGTAAQKLGASYDVIAAGKRACPYHFHHAQEEMFLILKGNGTLRVAEELIPVKEGDVIFIPPGEAYPHQLINTSEADLAYLSVSTREHPELVEYPDSGKLMSISVDAQGRRNVVLGRKAESLDYWEGEP
jgi:uncharacterized cupin superfamily protein